MSNPSRHHHYIPQFYLAGFTESGDKDDAIHVTDIREKKEFITNPRNVGAQRDFNRVDIPGVEIDELEKSFSKFESKVAPVLSRIIQKKTLPSGEEMEILVNFVALLGTRNPQIRSNFGAAQKQVMHRVAQLMVADRDTWESQLEQFKKENPEVELPDVSYEEMREFVEEQRYEIEFQHGHHATLELSALDSVLPFLFEREWSLLIADEKAGHFVCSDRPVVLNSKKEGRPPIGIGFGTPETELTMPISKRLAVLATFEGPSREVQVNRFIVTAVNSRIIGACDRQVYSPEGNFEYLGTDGVLHQSTLL